jgi:hypothetical protein
MKKLLLTLTCIAGFSGMGFAQTEKEDVAMAESIFGKAKKTIIMENIQIDDLKKTEFWNVYDEYEIKYDAISIERLKIIKEYAINYETLSDTTATRLATELIENSEKYDHLYKAYLGRFKKIVGGLKAATLYQIELYIQTAIQANVQSQVPVIGQLKQLEH